MFKVGDKVIYTDDHKIEYKAFIYKVMDERFYDNSAIIMVEPFQDKIFTSFDNIRRDES